MSIKSVDDLVVRVDFLDSLAFCIESSLEQAEIMGENEGLRRGIDLICILREQIAKMREEVEEVSQNQCVCNAIYAVNHVREMREELRQIKEKVRD